MNINVVAMQSFNKFNLDPFNANLTIVKVSLWSNVLFIMERSSLIITLIVTLLIVTLLRTHFTYK
jgi:hypothetical protein